MLSRRDFLRRALQTGAATLLPLGLSAPWPGVPGGTVRAAPASGQPLLIVVHAAGGWDPTLWIDPKGNLSTGSGATLVPDPAPVNNHYTPADILQASGIPYAPSYDADGYNETFMAAHADRLLVVNGVNMGTNSHSTGTMFAARGTFSFNPVLAAMYAGVYGPDLPLSFIGSGFTETLGVVPVSVSGRSDLLIKAAFPDVRDPSAPDAESNRFFPQAVDVAVDDLLADQSVPGMHDPLPGEPLEDLQAIYALYNETHGSASALTALRDNLPSEAELAANPFPDNPLVRQALIPIAGYKAGVCQAAQIGLGGFDTHGGHDVNHSARLRVLLQGLDGIMAACGQQAVDYVVMVTSDFGRTPGYNSGAGKDHHPVTSFVFLGAGVPGGRVVGGTTHFQSPLPVASDLTLLAEDAAGIELAPDDIHLAVRTLLGVTGTELAQRYPLPGARSLPLFTP